jgi:capsular exopolysaccharide synthesis family protein
MEINKEKKATESNETSLISTVMFRYIPYWPLFLVLLAAGIAGGWLYLRYATPQYEAYASVLIKDERKGVNESDVLEVLDLHASKKIIENEIEVIHSRKLMNEVVNQLHLYAPVFEEGKVKPVAAYLTSPITIHAKDPDKLKDTEEIYFTVKDNEVIINNKAYPMQQWVSTPYGELRFQPNLKKENDALGKLFFKLSNPKGVTSSLLSRLNVTAAGKLSTVVNLELKDPVPQRAEDILNRLVATYNQASVNEKRGLAANTLAFVENRLKEVEQELDSLEGNIQRYRAKKGVVNLSEQGRLFLENVGSNDRKISDLSMQLAALDQVEQYVNSQDNNSGIVPSTLGVNDPVLSQLMERMYNAKLEYEKLRKTTAENNPMVATVAKEVEQIRPLILDKIRNQRLSLQASKSDLSATNSMYNSMLRSIPQKERELTEISRQQTIKNSLYTFLLEKREQTALSISSAVPDSKIVDIAESSEGPVSPKRMIIYLASVVVALALGIGAISVKEMFNKKILFRSEIESLTSIPVVAEIPYTKKKEFLSTTKSKVSYVAEQFRQLRAAIGLCGFHVRNNRRIMVTSSISGEGKSYISINLAISLALSGKRVVLVDLDIRNPKTSSFFGVSEETGVAEFLEGSKMPEEIIRETEYTNLYTISAGGDIDNARESIITGKLHELLDHLNSEFDYIIMDTSPIDPVTDAYVFSDYCDSTLFVIRHNYTPKTMLQLFDSNNKIKALKNPYIVFNDVRSRGIFKGNYGYGYGYGYQNVYRDRFRKEAKRMAKV